MSLLKLTQARKCHSDFIRIVRRLYGAPYMVKPLCRNDLKGAYTDYTDFFGHTPFRRNLREKKLTRSRARESVFYTV